MKYCPNPECAYRVRYREPAEFLDRAAVCNDCGIALVEKEALDTDETKQRVSAWHQTRDEEAEARAPNATSSSHRVELVTGIVLMTLSLVLLVGSYSVASMGDGKYFIPVGAFIYGVLRLTRGLDARRLQERRHDRSLLGGGSLIHWLLRRGVDTRGARDDKE